MNWARVPVPEYRSPGDSQPPKPTPKSTRLADAARSYLDKIRAGEEVLASTSIRDLDFALGGGLAFGEMALAGARPGHGKSAWALQCLHHWTTLAPAVIVSEEMGTLMLGKRTLQHTTEVPQSAWQYNLDRLGDELVLYRGLHKDCFIVEGCGTADAAAEAVERHVEEHGIRYAVVD